MQHLYQTARDNDFEIPLLRDENDFTCIDLALLEEPSKLEKIKLGIALEDDISLKHEDKKLEQYKEN